MRNKIRAALRYYKSHIWIEIALSLVQLQPEGVFNLKENPPA